MTSTRRIRTPAFAIAALLCASSASAYPLKFPAHNNSLAGGAYFGSFGHGGTTRALDIKAYAFNGTGWQAYVGDDDSANANAYIWDAPLYAPVDGEIVACWNWIRDKPAPGVDYDIDGDGIPGEEDDDASPMSGGNHVQIRTADGRIVFLGHLKQDSIPPELCPLPANRDADGDGWPDNLVGADCDSYGDGWYGFRAGTILPTPVPVRTGDLIGRGGHSGASGAPHLHLHVVPFQYEGTTICQGPSEEIEFVETWSQVCNGSNDVTAAAWDPLDVENPLPVGSNPRTCFLPDAFGPQRDHHDLNVDATNLAFATHHSGDVVMYQDGGALRLRSFDVSASGGITLQDLRSEGTVLDAALTRPRSARDVVVSIRGSNGKLKLIPYDVDQTTGDITRQFGKEVSEGTVGQVESTHSPTRDGVVVAIEDGSGRLKVIDYDVSSSLNISRNSPSALGGYVDDIAITTLRTDFAGVVTAELSTIGKLTLRSFAVPSSGGATATGTANTLIYGTSVDVYTVATHFGTEEVVVTATILTDGTLRLDTWIVAPNGSIGWVDAEFAGAVSTHAASPAFDENDLVSVVRDGGDEIRMIGWSIGDDGAIRRVATREGGAITEAAISARQSNGLRYLVTGRTDAGGELHLFTYIENFTPYY